jgi:hypothetical protein
LFQERDLGLNLLHRLLVHVAPSLIAAFFSQVPQNVCNTRSSGSGGTAKAAPESESS